MNAKLLIAAVALLSSNAVFAANQAGDVYAGASYGQQRASVDIASMEFGVATGFMGYQINENFAVEGRVGVGISDESFFDDDINQKVKFGVDYTAQALAKGSYHFNDVVSAYGIAGFAKVKYSAGAGGANASVTDNGATYGFGLQMAVSSNSALHVEWQKLPDMDLDDAAGIDVTNISVGYTYRF